MCVCMCICTYECVGDMNKDKQVIICGCKDMRVCMCVCKYECVGDTYETM